MRNYKYSGQSLTFIAPESLDSGQPYVLGNTFGVVSESIIKGQAGELFVAGVFELTKDQAADINVGDRLYYDAENKRLTNKASPDPKAPLPLVGMAASYAGTDKNRVDCRLLGIPV